MGTDNTVQSSHPDAETAASAVTPSSLPTIRESTRLYSCCSRFPIRMGIAKVRISLTGFPTVISFVRAIDTPSSPSAADIISDAQVVYPILPSESISLLTCQKEKEASDCNHTWKYIGSACSNEEIARIQMEEEFPDVNRQGNLIKGDYALRPLIRDEQSGLTHVEKGISR